jgi:type II secretory pathway pseudopilin PulG
MVIKKFNIEQTNRRAAAYTMIELMVVVTIIIMIAAMLLGSLGSQSSRAEDRMNYLQWRDALVAIAKNFKWDYHKPSDPNAGRKLAELEFDESVRKKDLYYLWELIQPHFPERTKMIQLDSMYFNDSYFGDQWMTNLIGIDKTGYPYRTEGLEKLHLENTPLTDTGLKHLYQHVSYLQPKAPQIQAGMGIDYPMTNLLEINVFGCKGVTKQGIADLKKAFPHIKVISNWNANP